MRQTSCEAHDFVTTLTGGVVVDAALDLCVSLVAGILSHSGRAVGQIRLSATHFGWWRSTMLYSAAVRCNGPTIDTQGHYNQVGHRDLATREDLMPP